MRQLFVFGLIAFGIYYMGIGGSGILESFKNGNAALAIQGISADDLNAKIVKHYESTVVHIENFTADAIETTVTDLNDDGKKDVIAIVESGMTCGGGGCIASIFVHNNDGELAPIPFAYAVKDIEVLGSLTRGMHDLRINGDANQRMVWDGSTYIMESI